MKIASIIAMVASVTGDLIYQNRQVNNRFFRNRDLPPGHPSIEARLLIQILQEGGKITNRHSWRKMLSTQATPKVQKRNRQNARLTQYLRSQ